MIVKRTISVIIPTYNRATFIAESIQSVLDQDYGKYSPEVIVVDGGSTDETEKIVKQFGSRVIYKNLKQRGNPASARNAGLQMASGELVAFQDSDDVWPRDKMTTQLPFFDDASIVLTYGQADVIDKDGNPLSQSVVTSNALSGGERFKELVKTNSISTLTVIARKDILLGVGGFNESETMRGVEDYELWLRVLARNPRGIRCIQENLAHYRRHGDNISDTTQLRSLQGIYAALVSVWDESLSESHRAALEEQLNNIQENISRVMIAEKAVPKVSVIMSAYNSEKFLKQAMDSILGQTFHDFEFIIIDDGSTDTTRSIIKNYEDQRIRLVPQTNHGLVYSLNKAIALATAPFIARMDSDDVSLPARLQKEYEWLSANDDRGLVSTYFEQIEYENSEPNNTFIAYPPSHLELVRCLYYVNPFAHGAAMYRKQAAVDCGLYDAAYWPAEDYDLWRKMVVRYESALIPEVLFRYRIQNPNSISKQNSDRQAKLVAKIHDEIWQDRFARKSFLRIVVDYWRLPSLIPPESSGLLPTIKNLYLEQQFTLAKFSLLRGYFWRACEIILGLSCIKPGFSFILLRYAPQGVKKSLKRLK